MHKRNGHSQTTDPGRAEVFEVSDAKSSDQKMARRVDTWNAISHYLGRNTRTAQRWHKTLDLPVHFLRGNSGTVFAYCDELDEWLRSRSLNSPVLNHGALSPVRAEFASDGDEGLGAENRLSAIGSRNRLHSQELLKEAAEIWSVLTDKNAGEAARLFRKALDMDRESAEAYGGFALTMILQGLIGNVSLATAYSGAKVATIKAMELDPRSNLANCGAAWLSMMNSRDWEKSAKAFESVLKRDSLDPLARVGRALLYIAEGDTRTASDMLYSAWHHNCMSGLALELHVWSEYLECRYGEVLDHVSEVRESGHSGLILDAVEALTYAQYASVTYAIDRIERSLRDRSENAVAQGALAYLLAVDGRESDARAILRELSMRSHAKGGAYYPMSLALLGLGENTEAVQCIERSYHTGSLWSLGFQFDPALHPLRKDARFEQLICTSYPVERNERVAV
jgi:tetratricopeptide (TPR) repeat protein